MFHYNALLFESSPHENPQVNLGYFRHNVHFIIQIRSLRFTRSPRADVEWNISSPALVRARASGSETTCQNRPRYFILTIHIATTQIDIHQNCSLLLARTMADYDQRPRGGRGGYNSNRKRRYRGKIKMLLSILGPLGNSKISRDTAPILVFISSMYMAKIVIVPRAAASPR